MKQLAPYTGWIALISGVVALSLFILVPHYAVLNYTLGIIALGNGLFFIIADRENIRKSLKTRTALYGMNATVLVVAVLGILIFLNFIAARHNHRFDLTETGYYTLAPQTRKIVSNLPREVKITAFFQTDDPNRTEFQRLMEGYLALTDKIELTYVDPDKNPAITKRYGVTTYGTVIMESGSQETQVKNATEENITNALLKVTRDEKKTVYFLKGHGEHSIEDTEKTGYSKIKEALEKDNFEVKELLLLKTGEVPEDADLVIINGPDRPIMKEEQDALEAYLNRGGSLFVLLDPQTEVGLDSFLERWGVKIADDLIVDPMSKLFGGDSAAPVISQYSPHGITKDFTLPTIFPLLRSVKAAPKEGLETTEVLFSGQESWAEVEYQSGKVRFNSGFDTKGPVPVAVAVTKDLSSTGSQDAPAEPGPGADPAKPAVRKARLVVVGDSDFASNNYVSFSGNRDFFLNTASWMLREENLISIRARKRKHNPMPLTGDQGNIIFAVGVIILPALIILTGTTIWWKRRSL